MNPTQAYDKTPTELRQAALHWLLESDPILKAAGVRMLAQQFNDGEVALAAALSLQPDRTLPGRPARPLMVSPREVERRSMRTVDGRAAMIHALAHIEFNAINLALDAIWRFADMPDAYYVDWVKVAAEEALHFSLLREHMASLGFAYGDFNGHNSLWDMVEKTTDDVLARMALVPRTMEARGLDASPQMRAKLAQAGDPQAAAILDIILRDEIGHVAVGNHWFNWLCGQRGLEPLATYAALARQYKAPTPRGPFNLEARLAAGFTEPELAALERSANGDIHHGARKS